MRDRFALRVRMTKRSRMLLPMHLYGHPLRVGNILKDTLLVPAMMGSRSFQCVADNPGR